MRVTLLGSGSSAGVPLIGCNCAVCTSPNPKNKRSRPSIVIQQADTTLLVDSSPDLRQQALSHPFPPIDALLYTHAHADHTHGIDDVRSFNFLRNAPIDMYADSATLASLQERFPYAFLPAIPDYGWFRPCLVPHKILPYQPFTIGAITVQPFDQTHGAIASQGFRFGPIAYSTDVNHLSERAFSTLEGVSVWIIDCLRLLAAPTHAHLALTLEWINRIKPTRAILTHMGHDFDYDTLLKSLPEGVEPGYDGLTLEVEP